jgi:uncharacterized membrane protein
MAWAHRIDHHYILQYYLLLKFLGMNKLFDLRFVIGTFFTVIGVLLLIYAFVANVPDQRSVNSGCGGVFLVFGVLMIFLSLRKDAADELLEK